MDTTPSVRLPAGAEQGIVARPPAPLSIGRRTFAWGARTYVMGVINVTPDSFSGDGLLTSPMDPREGAVAQARRMVDEGADMLDVGGQSTRPGHDAVEANEELRRVVPVIEAVRAALPDVPVSVDTTRPAVAEAALAAGAELVNDVWGTRPSDEMARLVARSWVPYVLMHNRERPLYRNVVAELLADLSAAIDRAVSAGVTWERIIVDPGIGFGKTAEQNLAVLHNLEVLTTLGRPVLVGTSRKSTIGKVLDLPADERLEGTLATTALAIRAGVDIVRVHDVGANVRAARMADAIVRGGWHEERGE